MQEHEEFETLCALMASGQISLEESSLLQEHLASCASCSKLLAEFCRASADILSASAPSTQHAPSPELKKRFLARAASEGLRISSPGKIPFQNYRIKARATWVAGLAASILIAGFLYQHRSTEKESHAVATSAVEPQRRTPEASDSAMATQGLRVSQNAGASAPLAARLVIERDSLRRQLENSQQRLETLTQAVESSEREHRSDQAALLASQDRLRALSTERDTAIARLNSVNEELERSNSVLKATEVELAMRENSARLATEQARLEHAKYEQSKLVGAAGKEGASILAARNLHIVDVYNANGKGERQRAFGRVFYVEGKELIFYAYDLSSAKQDDLQFYAWGVGSSARPFVARLGIMHNDGNGEGLWELKFDDAGILSKIDSVMVTAETKETATPNGKRILVAVLGGQPNHP